MIKKIGNIILTMFMMISVIIPIQFTNVFSAENVVIVDDNETDRTKDHYFIYSEGKDQGGTHGWSNSDAKYGSGVLKTQHWVWTEDNTEASKHSYSFTFKGTGVDLIGIVPTGSNKNSFKLDDGNIETKTIETDGKKESILYSVRNLKNGVHTVEVTLPNDGQQKGLQISYAKVYGYNKYDLKEEKLEIPHTQREGVTNKFSFAQDKWETGNNEHTWSKTVSTTNPEETWYSVDFVGHKIDVYAGKNAPMGKVNYYIDGQLKGEYSLYNNSNINSTLIATFDNLSEGPHTFKAIATGKKDTNSSNNLIDASKVIVYHDSYVVEDIQVTQETYKLLVGAKQAIEVTVLPTYASVKDVTFSSNNKAVADVDANGVITAKESGTAKITVKAKNSDAQKIITVNVETGTPELKGSIVDVDTQYTQDRYNEISKLGLVSTELETWKNDKAISEIALISKGSGLKNVKIKTQDLVNGATKIDKENVQATFIKSTKAYVGPFLGYGDKKRPVPKETETNRKESSDILYQSTPIDMPLNSVQPVWISINIPKDAKAGIYTTKIIIAADDIKQPLEFTYKINVKDVVLKDATEFKNTFDIELWQHPYNSAEYYGVEPFSKEHFAYLKPIMELYKSIGGHAVTATISEDAWNGQTYSKKDVHYPSMIKWTKNSDGSFTYDYTNFDKWIQFNKDLGIGDKIVLYSIAPWHNSFSYWENGKLTYEKYSVGSVRYKTVWKDFLENLVSHLTEKGWFNEAYIGIDERGFSSAAFDVIESVKNSEGKCLKTAGAMSYGGSHSSLAHRVTDVNIGDDTVVSKPAGFSAFLADRKEKGLRTTLYTCTGHQPGNFSLSAPVESYWSIINAGKETDGLLRWAYDAWVENPLEDATHNAFEPGDCFLVYPGDKVDFNKNEIPTVRSSIRLERMAQGVRDVNKIRQMSSEITRLKLDVEAMYSKLTVKPIIRNEYLPKEKVEIVRQEMTGFRNDISAMTDKYIDLCKNGTNNIASIKINEGDQKLSLGNTKQLHVTFEPENVLNIDVDWTTSNAKVVSVDKNGVITANGLGDAIIEVISKQDPSKKANITVTTELANIEKEAQKAYYSFNNKDAKDIWGTRDGVVNGADFRTGKSGNALYIEKAGQNVTFAKDSGIKENDAWTLSYWVNASCPITERVSVMMENEKNYSLDMKLGNGRSAGYHVGKNPGDVLTFEYGFQKNTWYHIAWTQSKQDGLSMYVNGNLINNNAWTKSNKALLPFDIIGGTGFTGYIDEVKLYNRVLNQEEVKTDMLLKGLNIADKDVNVYLNDSYTIKTNLISDNENKTVTFTSLNPEIASVDQTGVVKGLKKGTTQIKVSAAGVADEFITISVVKKLRIANGLRIDKKHYDLNSKYLSDIEKKPGTERQYLGQPDMIRTKTGRLITTYPIGHGKGPLVMQISDDEGKTWKEKKDIPTSWANSQETPTIYKLNMADGSEKLILITACPGWGDGSTGWNTSISNDNGDTWSEYKHWHTKHADGSLNNCIVGMASLIQLKDENGNDIQKWMAVYHNYGYVNYRTYLTFDENGNEQWSEPEPYLSEYRDIESKYQMCEIGMFRSPDGKRIIGLARSQSHNNPSTLIYSNDEGKTWSKPMDLPGSLAGERHKAVYDPISGRLLITFREIQYDKNGNNKFDGSEDWHCGHWMAWIGTYEELMNQGEGEYCITLSKDYSQNKYGGDTGYAGVVVLEDGTFIMDSYGHWDEEFSKNHGSNVKTDLCYIRQAKFKLSDIENENGLVKYDALNDYINKVKDTKADAYTENSFKEFNKALTAAQKVVNEKVSQQVEVNKALETLKVTFAALKEKIVVNKEVLKGAIERKPEHEEKAYTSASWKAYKDALEQAKKVLANEKATQKEVDTVTKALQDAYNELIENPGWTPLEPSKSIIPWTELVPSHKVVPMTPLKPATSIDTTKPETSNNGKIENGETPGTGVSTNTALLWSVLLGTGILVVSLTNRKRKDQR